MELTLIRHGVTEYNEHALIQGGGSDTPLNALGRQQARQLATVFDARIYDYIVVSPMKRTLETAQILLGAQNQYTMDERLQETNFGDWEGQSITALQQQYPGCFDETGLILPDYAAIAHGETFQAVRERTRAITAATLKDYPNGKILFICHGSVIRALTAEMMHLAEVEQLDQVANLGLVRLKIQAEYPNNVRLLFYSRTYKDY
ncbi:histidine phosphatase family protein [Lactobacillus sp. CC-MHH1034]|uniref:histidine phosphatase family protein n=1 Tax=Agrilactobacillus fermenti TaxID=2586909 RepID=UPI001E2E09F8|nr:histidine phosphatase family protein [Agrilactobacillus fermenti]MCD2256802.1 histidine phosphatase family protein [Agrilactobacillus fermenti]